MGCNKCKEEEQYQEYEKCKCEIEISTDCSTYTGDDLICTEIDKGSKLTQVLQKIDKYICKLKKSNSFNLINIGGGSKVYREGSSIGGAEIRTIISSDEKLLAVSQQDKTIQIETGKAGIAIVNGTEVHLTTTTNGVKTTLSKIDLADAITEYLQDNPDIVCDIVSANCPPPKVTEGDRGARGAKGDPGKDGKVGPKGDKGDKGDAGSASTKGDTGPRGPKGDPGTNGTNGKDGADGVCP